MVEQPVNVHFITKWKAISPNIGLHVWLMTSKQTEPDLHFEMKNKRQVSIALHLY
jgi:hypothetical protein